MAEARADEHAEHAVHDEVARVFCLPASAHDLPFEEAVAAEEDAEEERAIVAKLELGAEVLRGEER